MTTVDLAGSLDIPATLAAPLGWRLAGTLSVPATTTGTLRQRTHLAGTVDIPTTITVAQVAAPSPVDGATVGTATPTFLVYVSFLVPPDTVARVEIATDTDVTDVIATADSPVAGNATAPTVLAVTDPLAEGTYYWRATVVTGGNVSAATATHTLTIDLSVAATAAAPGSIPVSDSGIPAAHLWFVYPAAGATGAHITCVGQGLQPGSSGVTVGGISATVVSATTVAAGSDAYTTGRDIDPATGTVDPAHDEIIIQVPATLAPPGGPVVVVTAAAPADPGVPANILLSWDAADITGAAGDPVASWPGTADLLDQRTLDPTNDFWLSGTLRDDGGLSALELASIDDGQIHTADYRTGDDLSLDFTVGGFSLFVVGTFPNDTDSVRAVQIVADYTGRPTWFQWQLWLTLGTYNSVPDPGVLYLYADKGGASANNPWHVIQTAGPDAGTRFLLEWQLGPGHTDTVRLNGAPQSILARDEDPTAGSCDGALFSGESATLTYVELTCPYANDTPWWVNEIRMYDAVLTGSYLSAARTYLADKYGLSA